MNKRIQVLFQIVEMQGIDDSFLIPRNPPQPELRTEVEKAAPPPAANIDNYPELVKSIPSYPYENLLAEYKTRMLNLLSNRIVQFVRQVAGNLGIEYDDMLLDIYKDFMKYLNSSMPKPGDTKFLEKMPVETRGLLESATEEEVENYVNRQQARQFTATERMFTLPSMLSELYFKAELASHTRESVQRIRQVCTLQNVSTSYLYDYLLHSDRWMPEFARMVSAWIIYDRRRKYVSTTGLQFDRSENDLLTSTVTFQQYFEIDLKDRVTTQRKNYVPVLRPVPQRIPPIPFKPRPPPFGGSTTADSETELEHKFAHVDM